MIVRIVNRISECDCSDIVFEFVDHGIQLNYSQKVNITQVGSGLIYLFLGREGSWALRMQPLEMGMVQEENLKFATKK